MKKLRSINWYYLAGTLPFVWAISYMSMKLLGNGWMKLLAATAGAAVTIWTVRKFWHLPRSEAHYPVMEACDLKLPVKVNAVLYLCPDMDRYEFLKRDVEILSPLFKNPNTPFRIAVSPRLLQKEGRQFVTIAVMREIIRYRQASQVKASLGLLTPVLTAVSLVEAYYAFGWNTRYPIAPGYINFFAPLLIALAAIAFLLVWNKRMSSIDYKVDDELKQFYSKKEIRAYIERWDELMQPEEVELINEKSRQLELYYRDQRIARL